MSPTAPSALLILATGLLTASCGAYGKIQATPQPDGSRLITAEEIAKSGASDAWDVLKRSHTYLGLRESRDGRPVGVVRRGHMSIHLDDSPRVWVDGAVLTEISYLRQLPANAIRSIRIYNGVEGTSRFGTGHGGGVVLILTVQGRGDPAS